MPHSSSAPLPDSGKSPGRSPLRQCLLWSLGIFFLPTVLLFFQGIENWRGERAWAAEKARLTATGFSLDYNDHIASPKDVPDELNVATASFYRNVYQDGQFAKLKTPFGFEPQNLHLQDSARTDPSQGLAPNFIILHAVADPRAPKLSDESKAALAVLKILSVHDQDLEKIRMAASRPHIRFPRAKLGEPQPPLNLCQNLATFLSLRSCALIVAGRPEEAFLDWKLLIRQAEIVRDSTLLGQLVEQAIISRSLAIVWYGLARGSWTETQLAEISAIYGKFDPAQNCIKAIKGESCIFMETMDRYALDRHQAAHDVESLSMIEFKLNSVLGAHSYPKASPAIARSVVNLMPTGWLRQNQASHSLAVDAMLKELQTATTPPGLFRPSALTSRNSIPVPAKRGIYNYLSQTAQPVYEVICDGSRQTTASLALVRTAIQIEEHRRKTGALPASLEQLTPPPPPDPITGDPLHYARLDDTRFKLWSVALNAINDGGKVKERPGERTLDWLWLSYIVPAKKPL